jgi:hypothetical protein
VSVDRRGRRWVFTPNAVHKPQMAPGFPANVPGAGIGLATLPGIADSVPGAGIGLATLPGIADSVPGAGIGQEAFSAEG